MSNIISLSPEKHSGEYSLCMSNGGTDAFMSAFALAGSRLAKKRGEKLLVIYLLEQNQYVMGNGCVSFDISEMPFGNLESDKEFLISVCEGIKRELGSETLERGLNSGIVSEYADTFARLVNCLTPEDINSENLMEWLSGKNTDDRKNGSAKNDPVINGISYCKKHRVLNTWAGCFCCADEDGKYLEPEDIDRYFNEREIIYEKDMNIAKEGG